MLHAAISSDQSLSTMCTVKGKAVLGTSWRHMQLAILIASHFQLSL